MAFRLCFAGWAEGTSKDQGYGFIVFIVSLIVVVVYLAAFFAPWIGLDPRLQYYAIGIPVLLFVLLVLVISVWIGWTMLTTPPPAPLEPEPATAAESKSPQDASVSENTAKPSGKTKK